MTDSLGYRAVKGSIKKHLPSVISLVRNARCLKNRMLWQRRRDWSLKEVFQDAYEGMSNLESASGGGSTLSATIRLRELLPQLLRELGTKSMLDAPCGDFNWMSRIPLPLDIYLGCDIVPELIEKNKQKYENSKRRFSNLDITRDPLPRVDLILCRDCLVHFSYENILATIANFIKSGSKYLLTTTFTQREKNKDIITGDWRPINLCKLPFCFGEPLRLINENYMKEDLLYTDKSLGLWGLKNIPSPHRFSSGPVCTNR
jgi:hypothetical protein